MKEEEKEEEGKEEENEEEGEDEDEDEKIKGCSGRGWGNQSITQCLAKDDG